MAHSSRSWKEVEQGLTPEEKEKGPVSPELDFKALQHQAFKALEEAHKWKEKSQYPSEARDQLCEDLPGSENENYVALIESGENTEILLYGFESVDGEIYARRHPEIEEDSPIYENLLQKSENSEKYLESSTAMEQSNGKSLSFPSGKPAIRLYAPDLEY